MTGMGDIAGQRKSYVDESEYTAIIFFHIFKS